MSTNNNKSAWVTAKAGRVQTISAANGVIVGLKRDGVIGYCQDSQPFAALVKTAAMSPKLASDYPANYWIWYPNREPESFDDTAWVKSMEAECRAIAAQPLPR